MESESRIVSASREVSASAQEVFDLIADPVQQPTWDGNDNLAEPVTTERITDVGQVFTMLTTKGNVRDNTVVEFQEGRRIAWLPSMQGGEAPGHLWRWEVEPLDDAHCRVTHTYDWTGLTDEARFERARWTTVDRLLASIERLAARASS